MPTDDEVLFTREQAAELLERIRPAVEELALVQSECEDPDRRIRISQLTSDNASSAAMLPLLAPAERLLELLDEVTAHGVIVRDPQTGLLDFPAMRDGEEIYLCWRLGEDEIGHWHSRETGFSDRRPL